MNRDLWLKSLAELEGPIHDDALTVRELGELFQCHRTAAQAKARALVSAGHAIATRKRVVDATGRTQIIIAYRLKESNDVRDGARSGHARRPRDRSAR